MKKFMVVSFAFLALNVATSLTEHAIGRGSANAQFMVEVHAAPPPLAFIDRAENAKYENLENEVSTKLAKYRDSTGPVLQSLAACKTHKVSIQLTITNEMNLRWQDLYRSMRNEDYFLNVSVSKDSKITRGTIARLYDEWIYYMRGVQENHIQTLQQIIDCLAN